MAKITRIKASDGPRKKEDDAERTIVRKKVSVTDKKTAKAKRAKAKADAKKISLDTPEKAVSKAGKADKNGAKTPKVTKTSKKPFILFRPFVALGHYLRDSWRELRQVRWPNRKLTWKMVLAVIVYSLLFVVLISVLDVFFSWLFNLMLSK